MSNLPYRRHEFTTPPGVPYEVGPNRWPTIVGRFLEPIVRDRKNLLYWFCFHGADFEFSFASKDYKRIEKKIEAARVAAGFGVKTAPAENKTTANVFGGTRWVPQNQVNQPDFVEHRSEALLKFLHATSALFINNLVQDGEYWKIQPNVDTGNNPDGQVFESPHHMFCNITGLEPMMLETNQAHGMQKLMSPLYYYETHRQLRLAYPALQQVPVPASLHRQPVKF
jgi:hypothetical protein